MRHNLPPTPAFRDALPTDPIQELALRVVVELPGWEMHVIGTATLICGHLAVTAKHVLDAIISRFGARQSSKGVEIDGYSIRLYQVLPGPIYRVWIDIITGIIYQVKSFTRQVLRIAFERRQNFFFNNTLRNMPLGVCDHVADGTA